MAGVTVKWAAVGAFLLTSLVASTPHAAKKRSKGENVDVQDVVATPDGNFVVLLKTRVSPIRVLPIWIGQNEAMAIRMRLERQKPPRPLTLNLLESVMSSSNIKLLEVKVDRLERGVFLGKLRLRQNGRVWELDARPSDAIGLAVGKDAPIWVANEVLDEAGVRPDEEEQKKPDATKGEGKPTSFEETL